MATITIQGKKVTVDDEFLNLSREEQDAVVEDIAADMQARGDFDGGKSKKDAMTDRLKEKMPELRANQSPIVDAIGSSLNRNEPGDEKWVTPGEGESRIPIIGDFARSLYPFEKNVDTGEMRLSVPKIVDGTIDLLTLPGDVASGKTDPMSDEGIARAVGLATIMTPGAPKVAPKPLPAGNTLAVVPKVGSKSAVPTAAELKTVAQKAYDQAKGSEMAPVLTGKSLGDSLTDVLAAEGLLRPDGKIQGSFGTVRTAMKDVESFKGKPMTFEQFQRLEEGLQNVAASKNAGEARIGNLLLKAMDDYFAKLPDEAFTATKGGAAATKEGYFAGKEVWAQYSKLSRVERALAKAERAKGGFTEGLRSEFRTILNSQSKSRGFSADELAIMDKFVKGGKLEAVTGWLGGLRNTVLGTVAGGPLVGGAMALSGGLSGMIGKGGAKSTANQLRLSAAQGKGNTLKTSGAVPRPSTGGPVANTLARASGASEEAQRMLRLRAAAM